MSKVLLQEITKTNDDSVMEQWFTDYVSLMPNLYLMKRQTFELMNEWVLAKPVIDRNLENTFSIDAVFKETVVTVDAMKTSVLNNDSGDLNEGNPVGLMLMKINSATDIDIYADQVLEIAATGVLADSIRITAVKPADMLLIAGNTDENIGNFKIVIDDSTSEAATDELALDSLGNKEGILNFSINTGTTTLDDLATLLETSDYIEEAFVINSADEDTVFDFDVHANEVELKGAKQVNDGLLHHRAEGFDQPSASERTKPTDNRFTTLGGSLTGEQITVTLPVP